MQDVMKWLLIVIVAVICVLGLTWVVQGNDFFLYRYFAPRQEQVRRDVFETSRAFNQGLNQEVQNMRFEYEQAEPEHRSALRAIILHRVAGYEDHLSPDLRSWVTTMKGEHVDVEAR